MAAGGMTNPQIAESLFITTKTVKAHIGHILTKLDIASRTQIPGALQQGEPGASTTVASQPRSPHLEG